MEREIIYGQVVSKANNYEVGNDKHGGRYIIKSEAIRAYERSFIEQCQIYKDRLINCHFTLYVAVYESSVRYDLDNALKTREFGIRKSLKKLWEWNIFSTFIVDNQ